MEETITVTFEGPDGEGFVWATTEANGLKSTINLGKCEDVEEAMSQFLGQQDYRENDPR